jgi:hypothetical protein
MMMSFPGFYTGCGNDARLRGWAEARGVIPPEIYLAPNMITAARYARYTNSPVRYFSMLPAAPTVQQSFHVDSVMLKRQTAG